MKVQPTAINRPQGFRLFRLLGIDVWVHWSWLLVAVFEVQSRARSYGSQLWNVIEYLTLFAIVLMHEFGHALACRSVGGKAERILLWPMGGVAYVDPPHRPGALLWSIVAGPLVNAVLIPVTVALALLARSGWLPVSPDVSKYLMAVMLMNVSLLIFNLLPIYPLDGGKILRSLLWFAVGDLRSLQIASVVGLIGGAAGLAFGVASKSPWFIFLALFGGLQSWRAFQATQKHARALEALKAAPTRGQVHCAACGRSPPIGPFWVCPCGQAFDTFATSARCPKCSRAFAATRCPSCQELRPLEAWSGPIEPTAP
jgi:Zn-dependent protease